MPVDALASEVDGNISQHERNNRDANDNLKDDVEGDEPTGDKPGSDNVLEKEIPALKESRVHRAQIWTEIRPSLCAIEDMMSFRVKKKGTAKKNEQLTESAKLVLPFEEVRSPKGASEEDSEDEFYDVERSESSDHIQDAVLSDSSNVTAPEAMVDAPLESSFPWKEELEVLVRGGVPMALRGEVYHIPEMCFWTKVQFHLIYFFYFHACISALASLCRCENTPGAELLSGSVKAALCWKYRGRANGAIR